MAMARVGDQPVVAFNTLCHLLSHLNLSLFSPLTAPTPLGIRSQHPCFAAAARITRTTKWWFALSQAKKPHWLSTMALPARCQQDTTSHPGTIPADRGCYLTPSVQFTTRVDGTSNLSP